MAFLIFLNTTDAHKTFGLPRTLHQEKEVEIRTKLHNYLEIIWAGLADNKAHFPSNTT